MTYRHDPETAGREAWLTGHACLPPMKRVEDLPYEIADAYVDDAWRCDCGQLWIVGPACDRCADRRFPGIHSHPRPATYALAWRTATIWQRIRYALRPETR